jgi:hypothetical protein
MKVNIALISTLSALLIFAYFWEEKKGKASTEIQLFIGEPQSLVLKNVVLEKKNNNWQLQKYQLPIGANFSQLISRMLSGLSIIKEIKIDSNKTHEYFALTNIDFKLNEQDFTLGDYSQVDKGFYIKNNQALYLVRDSKDYEGVFRSLDEEEFKKYQNLKNLIDSKMSFLFPTSIIQSLLKVKSINVLSPDGEFKLFVKNNNTFPDPMSGLKVVNIQDRLLSLNNTGKIINVIDLTDKPVEKELVKVIVNFENQSSEFFLYNQFKGVKGHFIWNGNLGVVIQVDSVENTFFSSSVSDYWLKQFSLLESIKSKKTIKFSLISNSTEIKGRVIDTSTFSYSSSEYDLNKSRFNLLFGVLLNNSPFEQASFVKSRSEFKYDFDFVVDNQRYSIRSLDGILNVYEHSTQIEFVFVKQKIFLPRLKIDDFFTLKKKKP